MPTSNYIITTKVIVIAVSTLVVLFIGIGTNRYLKYVDEEKAQHDAERKYQIDFNLQYISKMDTLIWLNKIQNEHIEALANRLTENEEGDKQVRKAVRQGERIIDE